MILGISGKFGIITCVCVDIDFSHRNKKENNIVISDV